MEQRTAETGVQRLLVVQGEAANGIAERREPENAASQPEPAAGQLEATPGTDLVALQSSSHQALPAEVPPMDLSTMADMIASNDVSALRSMAQNRAFSLRIDSGRDSSKPSRTNPLHRFASESVSCP